MLTTGREAVVGDDCRNRREKADGRRDRAPRQRPGYGSQGRLCCTWRGPAKEFTMPHTAPKRPTYGLVEPTVAKERQAVSSFSLAGMATRMARATPSITASGSTPDCWRRRELLKAARKSAPPPSPDQGCYPPGDTAWTGRCPTRNALSEAIQRALGGTHAVLRWKIMTQESTDAATRVSMTSCTTRLA